MISRKPYFWCYSLPVLIRPQGVSTQKLDREANYLMLRDLR